MKVTITFADKTAWTLDTTAENFKEDANAELFLYMWREDKPTGITIESESNLYDFLVDTFDFARNSETEKE